MQIPSSTPAGRHTPASIPASQRKFEATVATDLPEEIFAELRRPSQPTNSVSPSKQSGKIAISPQDVATPAKVNDGGASMSPTYRASGQKTVPAQGAVTVPRLGTMIDVIA